MTALVRQWEAGSEPRQAFARRHGLTVACLDYWTRRVRHAAVEAPAVIFAPVQVIDADAGRGPAVLELVLPSGERLRVPAGVTTDHVRVVLAALHASC